MSERYSRLFALPSELYTTTSPVVIAAGALLKDNQTDKVLAQLKLRSVSPKIIKAVKVCITALDTADRVLGEVVEHQYLDLNISRDAEFGQKSAILLPDSATRRFSAIVTEVVFVDNSMWTSSDCNWRQLPASKSLVAELDDTELVKQYQLTFGKQCQVAPLSYDDLWFCSCGATNHNEESNCHTCGLEYAKLNAVQWDALKQARDERLAAEKAEAEQQAAIAMEQAEQARKKARKTKVLISIASGAIALALACYLAISMLVIKPQQYTAAETLLENGKHAEAAIAFYKVGKYKDAQARSFELWNKCAPRAKLAYGSWFSTTFKLEVTEDGRVRGSVPAHDDTYSWRDIVAVVCGEGCAAGLKADGTVVAVGFRGGNTSRWRDIVSISVGYSHLVGLKADGTVVAVGLDAGKISSWRDIVEIDCTSFEAFGLKADGTVVAATTTPKLNTNLEPVQTWTDIVDIYAYGDNIEGTKSDGTVVTAGK